MGRCHTATLYNSIGHPEYANDACRTSERGNVAPFFIQVLRLSISNNTVRRTARAGQQEKGLMNVRAALVADPQSAKSVKPPEGSFDNPTPASIHVGDASTSFRYRTQAHAADTDSVPGSGV
jgi:hypothetical protein